MQFFRIYHRYSIRKVFQRRQHTKTPRKYKPILFVRCLFIEAILILREQRELKIHLKTFFVSKLTEAVPGGKEDTANGLKADVALVPVVVKAKYADEAKFQTSGFDKAKVNLH